MVAPASAWQEVRVQLPVHWCFHACISASILAFNLEVKFSESYSVHICFTDSDHALQRWRNAYDLDLCYSRRPWSVVWQAQPYSYLSGHMIKATKCPVRPAKTLTSLGICPVWSESPLSAWRNFGSLATHWAHSKDWSDSVDAQADLSLRMAHMPFFLVLSCSNSFFLKKKKALITERIFLPCIFQLLDLFVNEDWSVYLADYGNPKAKYLRVQPHIAINILEKWVSVFSSPEPKAHKVSF